MRYRKSPVDLDTAAEPRDGLLVGAKKSNLAPPANCNQAQAKLSRGERRRASVTSTTGTPRSRGSKLKSRTFVPSLHLDRRMDWIVVKTAAFLAHRSEQLIYKWRRRGKVESITVRGRIWINPGSLPTV